MPAANAVLVDISEAMLCHIIDLTIATEGKKEKH
jgi:hypothetical protein